MFKKLLFYFIYLLPFLTKAQKTDTSINVFYKAESELSALQKLLGSRDEAQRIEANKKIIAVWNTIIDNPKILDYPFESIKEMSILKSNDNKCKIITWNLFKNDGTHAFFGYVLVNNSKRVKKGFLKYETIQDYEYFQLVDRSPTVKSPESYIGTPDKWFGMLYTQIIDCNGYYTLLGWDGNDKLTQRKFVDVLSFKSDGTPVFGKDVFKLSRRNPRRLMFEYSSEVTMSLKYNEKLKQIVYSHLASRQENALQGQYQFYGPDGSYDALELAGDKWVTIEDVDARNEKNKNDNAEKPDPKKQKPIFKPK